MKIFKALIWTKIYHEDEYSISAETKKDAEDIAYSLSDGWSPEECSDYESGIIVKHEGTIKNENFCEYKIIDEETDNGGGN